MASPRTMFSGTLQVSPLIQIPITIGKATSDEREKSLVEVCVHDNRAERISRSEYCKACHGSPKTKRMAVEIDGGFRILSDDDLEAIDEANGGSTLKLIDCQPAKTLPLLYSQGTYYVRHNDGAKITPDAFATLTAAMMVERIALVVKWRRKLCALTAERGVLVLRVMPYHETVRPASKKERAHMATKVEPKAVVKMGALLHELQNPDGFDYAGQRDEGLARRQEVVDRIIKGEKPKRKAPPKKQTGPIDFEKLIDQAIDEVRG